MLGGGGWKEGKEGSMAALMLKYVVAGLRGIGGALESMNGGRQKRGARPIGTTFQQGTVPHQNSCTSIFHVPQSNSPPHPHLPVGCMGGLGEDHLGPAYAPRGPHVIPAGLREREGERGRGGEAHNDWMGCMHASRGIEAV